MSALVARVTQQWLTWCTASRSACVVLAFVSRSGGSGDGCWASSPVAWAAEQAARLVRGLGAGVDARAAALVLGVGCRLRVAWVTEPAARMERGPGDWEEGFDCFSFLDTGVCMIFGCQVSTLQPGPTCQKVIKWVKSPDQYFLQQVYCQHGDFCNG